MPLRAHCKRPWLPAVALFRRAGYPGNGFVSHHRVSPETIAVEHWLCFCLRPFVRSRAVRRSSVTTRLSRAAVFFTRYSVVQIPYTAVDSLSREIQTRRRKGRGRRSAADSSLRVGRASPLVQGRAGTHDPRSGRGRALRRAVPATTVCQPHPAEIAFSSEFEWVSAGSRFREVTADLSPSLSHCPGDWSWLGVVSRGWVVVRFSVVRM